MISFSACISFLHPYLCFRLNILLMSSYTPSIRLPCHDLGKAKQAFSVRHLLLSFTHPPCFDCIWIYRHKVQLYLSFDILFACACACLHSGTFVLWAPKNEILINNTRVDTYTLHSADIRTLTRNHRRNTSPPFTSPLYRRRRRCHRRRAL